jgi:hypothetical protein
MQAIADRARAPVTLGLRAQVLVEGQRLALRAALAGRPLALCFGAGVDSTAMIVALHDAGLRPSVITFADTGGERARTYEHLDRMQSVVRKWGWPPIELCRKRMLPTTPYNDLYGNCWENETLPSIAFGMSSCSIKFKGHVQDQHLMGVSRGPNKHAPHPAWVEAQKRGVRFTKLIGFDCSKADLRRASNAAARPACEFDFAYPLQLIAWTRDDCVRAITRALGKDFVPVKSACFFCSATKQWELFDMAAYEPELLERAIALERRALTGRHSRFSEVDFGASWDDLVRNADRFPSSNTTVGLGRSFAWAQWALRNGVVDQDFKVQRQRRHRFIEIASAVQAGTASASRCDPDGPSTC